MPKEIIASITSQYDHNMVEVDLDSGMPDCGDRVQAIITRPEEFKNTGVPVWQITASFIINAYNNPENPALTDIWHST